MQLKQKQAGFSWVSVLIVFGIVGAMMTQETPSLRAWRLFTAKRILFQELSHVLIFARLQAFIEGEPLVLFPAKRSKNWAQGVKLQSENTVSTSLIHAWYWHVPAGIRITWHGFQANDQIMIHKSPEQLAMNGYFLVEVPQHGVEHWVVSRFGRMRVRRIHVD